MNESSGMNHEILRYSRQIILDGFGAEGQKYQ